MQNRIILTALLALVISVSAILAPVSVAGESSTEEIRIAPNDISLAKGDTQTIEINYKSLSGPNPKGIEFDLEYDPDVISVIDTKKGGYLVDAIPGEDPTASPGEVAFGSVRENPVDADSGTVATITIELADGVSSGATTDLTFTSVKTIGIEGAPEKFDGTVKAIEGTDEAPRDTPETDVQITDPTLSPTKINDSSGDHALKFDIKDVSADNVLDNVSVTLPDSVTVEDVTDTTVTNEDDETVDIVGSDPATLPDPGNEISFAVNPIAATDTQTLDVEIELTLSATP
jgi:hypothetical protein